MTREQSDDRLVPLCEAAKTLAVSKRTLYRFIAEGMLRKIKVRGRSAVAWSDVQRLIQRFKCGGGR